MSAQRPLSSAGSSRTLKAAVCLATATAALVAMGWLGACRRGGDEQTWEAVSARSPDGARFALVRARVCPPGLCQTIWIGATRDTATLAGTLAATERVDEIAWTPDGRRVGFLVNGYQLRLYDPDTLSPAGQFSLITPDGQPSSRIARGVTFSENGRAVTFDDCPRARSGCRSGLMAVPR